MRSLSTTEWIEGILVILLLIPFYGWLLPRPAPVKIWGFVYLALICSYILFFSPHRTKSRSGLRSLYEVPVIVGWCMFVIWGVLPMGFFGKHLGQVLLVLTGAYILLLSGPRHGDTLEDWGIGSPARNLSYLTQGPRRSLAWTVVLATNAVTAAFCLLKKGLAVEVLKGLLRRSFGIRNLVDIPTVPLLIGFLTLANLFLLVVRYDNLPRAARIIGGYLLVGAIAVGISGYIYIFRISGGWVDFVPERGVSGVGAYILWGVLQELLFLSYFNTRIRKGITSPLLSAILTAIVFSIFHLTAYTLMFICFGIGIVWALIFQEAPNLILLGASHGISGGFGSAFKVQGMEMFKIKASVGPFNM